VPILLQSLGERGADQAASAGDEDGGHAGNVEMRECRNVKGTGRVKGTRCGRRGSRR
jgi:hypothetical protein